MNNLDSGFYVVGQCLGIRTADPRTLPDGSVVRDVFVGLSYPKPNGFDGETIVIEVKMSKAALDDNYQLKLEKLKNQYIAAPVNTMSRVYNNRVYSTHYIDAKRAPIPVSKSSIDRLAVSKVG